MSEILPLHLLIKKLKRILPKQDYKLIIDIVFIKNCHLCPREKIVTMPICINIQIPKYNSLGSRNTISKPNGRLWVCDMCYKRFEENYKDIIYSVTINFMYSWRAESWNIKHLYR